MLKKESCKAFFSHWLLETLKCILMGITIGVLIALYKYAFQFVNKYTPIIFDYNNLANLSVGIISALALMFITYYLIISEGSIQGSGLPQLQLNIEHKKGTIRWYRAIPFMFISSLTSFYVGMPLGGEAPSTFMSGVVGLAYKRLFKYEDNEDLSIGAGAGFGAVFLSPLSGIMYAFEESIEKFSWGKLYKTIIVAALAYVISYLINPNYIIKFDIDSGFNWIYSYYLLFILLFTGLIAFLMIKGMHHVKTFINHHHQNFFIKNRYFIVYILSLAMLIGFPLLSGNGHLLIEGIMDNQELLQLYWFVILFLVYRIVVFLIVGNSMASGGLMLPTLCIGAIIGQLIVLLMKAIPGYDVTQNGLIILLSMITLFAFVNKVPFTGFALILSLGGWSNALTTVMPAFILMFVVFLATKFIKIDSLNRTRRKLLKTSREQRIDEQSDN